MKILLLGGTGAIGTSITKYLNCSDNEIHITSRRNRNDSENVHYLLGDAHNDAFLDQILQTKYDVIVDLMIYTTEELKARVNKLIQSTDHYFFMSSSRVYANSSDCLSESSPLIIDVCKDYQFLQTDDYALSKAREERIISDSKLLNWTIVRPYITYGYSRFQLGVFEKEDWLFRAINGRTIVFMNDIADKYTSLTYGDDVGMCIAKLIGKSSSKGEFYNIANPENIKWMDILDIYKSRIENKLGREIDVLMLKDSIEFQKVFERPYQIIYDRAYDRRFDSTKIIAATGVKFTAVHRGLSDCIDHFLEDPRFGGINGRYEGWFDKQSKQFTPILQIPGKRSKLHYLVERFL